MDASKAFERKVERNDTESLKKLIMQPPEGRESGRAKRRVIKPKLALANNRTETGPPKGKWSGKTVGVGKNKTTHELTSR